MPGPGIDFPAALGYIGPERAAVAAEKPEFDYDALVRPLEDRMMRSIWRIVRDREAAQDALQDALTAIWRKRRAVARHPKPEALILRMAICAAYDACRRRRRLLRHEVLALPDDRARDPAAPITQGLEDLGLRAAVLEAIARLPKRQATAVLLHFVEERSYDDIASAMGCAAATVRVHVMRGRERLARHLAGRVPGLEPGTGASRRNEKEAVS